MTAIAWRRPWIILFATLIGVASTARLGIWQLGRASEKLAIQAALDSRALLPVVGTDTLARDRETAQAQRYRKVHLRGRWLAQRTVFLENRQMHDQPGFYVVTPLRLWQQPDAVLVQRGWAPRDQADRTRLPILPTPPGVVEVEGVIAAPPSRLFEFAAVATGAIRQNLDLDGFGKEIGVGLRPLSVLQTDTASTAGDGLLRQWPRVAANVQMHYGYAFQWFALSALMTGLYVWFQLIRRWRRSVT